MKWMCAAAVLFLAVCVYNCDKQCPCKPCDCKPCECVPCDKESCKDGECKIKCPGRCCKD